MKNEGWGSAKLGVDKIYTLACADNIVLLAENEEEMAGVVTGLEKYLDKKKVMRSNKGGGRKKNWTVRCSPIRLPVCKART